MWEVLQVGFPQAVVAADGGSGLSHLCSGCLCVQSLSPNEVVKKETVQHLNASQMS